MDRPANRYKTASNVSNTSTANSIPSKKYKNKSIDKSSPKTSYNSKKSYVVSNNIKLEDRNVQIYKKFDKMWYTYGFFDVFGQIEDNISIFERLNLCKNIWDFVNLSRSTTIFTYGQTGSGKTFTLFGSAPELLGRTFSCRDSDFDSKSSLLKDGVAQLTIKNIFNCINAQLEMGVIEELPQVELQLYQLYNDEIKDLLSSKEFVPSKGVKKDLLKFGDMNNTTSRMKTKKESITQNCIIKVNKNGDYELENITTVPVDNAEDCMWFVNYALENLVARTSVYQHYSTRGHCVFSLRMKKPNPINPINNSNSKKIKGKDQDMPAEYCTFQFIDLAGSEKFEKQEMKSIGSLECKKINNSLFVLRKVISVLAWNNNVHNSGPVKQKEKEKEKEKLNSIEININLPKKEIPFPLKDKRSKSIALINGASSLNKKENTKMEQLQQLKMLKQQLLNQKSTNNNKKKMIIPYRECVLTKVLKASLEGNGSILMIANLSPNEDHFEENISTLEWAAKASKITFEDKPEKVNIDDLLSTIEVLKKELFQKEYVLKEKEEVINTLKSENIHLKTLTSMKREGDMESTQYSDSDMQRHLERRELKYVTDMRDYSNLNLQYSEISDINLTDDYLIDNTEESMHHVMDHVTTLATEGVNMKNKMTGVSNNTNTNMNMNNGAIKEKEKEYKDKPPQLNRDRLKN